MGIVRERAESNGTVSLGVSQKGGGRYVDELSLIPNGFARGVDHLWGSILTSVYRMSQWFQTPRDT